MTDDIAYNTDDICPICLDPLTDDTHTMAMPDCKHILHVRCALSAMHYDHRCPVCRHDVVIPHAAPFVPDVFTQFELELAQREMSIRRYQNRKSRLIRRRKSLQKLRDILKHEKRLLTASEKELERTWSVLQRQMWAANADIQGLKLRRRKHQRRVVDLRRRLRGRLDPIIGVPPDEEDEF